jgi:hypothetical protein
LSGTGESLSGGQGKAVRYDDLVLKPCENPIEWTGLAPLLASLQSVDYRVAHPIRYPNGEWVLDGWMVTELLEGEPGYAGREAEALSACDAIHRDLSRAYVAPGTPEWLEANDSCWSRADLIAWGELPPDRHVHADTRRALADLCKHVHPLADPVPQIAHGDPGGDNLLFSEHAPPGIIDFSAYWRPSGYAVAMMLSDGVAWEGSSVETLELVAERTDMAQLLLRAVCFRLAVSDLFSGPGGLESRLTAYAPVTRWAIEREESR